MEKAGSVKGLLSGALAVVGCFFLAGTFLFPVEEQVAPERLEYNLNWGLYSLGLAAFIFALAVLAKPRQWFNRLKRHGGGGE